ncbi:hypothetical protein L9F63_004982 [Diploptera punctata]|uniref:BTB domain-containing protein n=1 Tax=Diploptera punctata TaxID=6984 RepID=A0AAD8E6P3_DIPPU|nr:hypothetical protein L9F63_004982 [Diploptera punctata]
MEKNNPFDVVLKVGDVNFPCHRKTLADYSPYFQAMFSDRFIEKDKECIEIQGVDSEAMAMLLQSIYKKEELNLLTSQNILSILQASSMLQFESIQKTCIDLIVHEWLNITTCLQTMKTAHQLDLITLYQKARALALWEFSKVKMTDAFLDLSIDQVSEYLENDALNTTESEFEVFEAGLSWIQFKPLQRSRYLNKVLECIRYCDISVSDIRTMFLYPFINEDLECQQILKCILCIKEGKEVREQSPRQSIESVDSDNYMESRQKKIKTCMCIEIEKKETNSLIDKCCRCCTGIQEPITPSDEIQHSNDTDSERDTFSIKIITSATQLLSKSQRTLPFVPCVVGHKMDKNEKRKDINDEIRKSISYNGKPYIIYFQEGKSHHPIPFLHLSKANEGPLEPTGYKVICRGRDLYIIGGELLLGHGNWNCSIWKYDLITESWTYETSISTPRRHHSICCHGDYIYIIGGFGRHRVIMNSVERYHIESKCWDRRAPLPRNLYSVACCTFNEHIFVFGPQVYIYHPSSDNWFVLSEAILPSGAAFTSAMPYGKSIYLTCIYSRELTRFTPHLNGNEKQVSRFESVGSFVHNTSNTCLVHDVIYSFSTDDLENTFVEAYYIAENKFNILWDSVSMENNDILDFSAKHSIGCFPLLKY